MCLPWGLEPNGALLKYGVLARYTFSYLCLDEDKLRSGISTTALAHTEPCMMSAQEPLMQGLIEKIAVLVLDSSGCVVERFTMQLKVSHPWLTQIDGLYTCKSQSLHAQTSRWSLKGVIRCVRPLVLGRQRPDFYDWSPADIISA